jgi:sigma-B regulation protein RsbU (phosphoserine phosphatase)
LIRFSALFLAILYKLSPARRVFLLAILSLASISLAGVELSFVTRQFEFSIAFASLLLLLVMVPGNHVAMRRGIEIAREIQRWLVPRVPPDLPGIDRAFATRPAQTVAGDYDDAFRRTSDGPLLLAVADVSGKSVPAAMLMAIFQASLRALAGSPGPLSELVSNLNRLVCANNLNGRCFTTAFLAELDPATGELTFLSAGHNPPILLREDGSIERLQSESIPLGIEFTEKFPTNTTVLQSNDMLLIYTDGVPEARSSTGQQLGEGRLRSAWQHRVQERAAETLSAIMKKLDEFVGPASQHDDITCMVVRRT